jgi:hypothetical protein
VSLLFTAAAPVAATDLFPLTEGVLRTYESVSQAGTVTYTTTFSGTAIVRGVETQVLHHAGGPDDGSEQFWSASPAGDKYLHGWYRSDCQCGAEYDPPVLWMDEPLVLDKAWDVTTEVVGFGTVILHFEVTAVGSVTVPAGTFDGYTIDWYSEEPPVWKSVGLQSDGRRAPGGVAGPVSSETYADAAGLVRYVRGTTQDTLQRFETVGVEAATWTGIRQLYR